MKKRIGSSKRLITDITDKKLKIPKEKSNNSESDEFSSSGEDNDNYLRDLELGEYFLHIYILETAKISIPGSKTLKLRVKALDQSKYSRDVKGITKYIRTFWGEHFFFQKVFKSRADLENAHFEISIFDQSITERAKNFAGLNSLHIGSTSGNLI